MLVSVLTIHEINFVTILFGDSTSFAEHIKSSVHWALSSSSVIKMPPFLAAQISPGILLQSLLANVWQNMQKPFQTPFNLCNFKRAAQIYLQGRKFLEENEKFSRPGAAWNHAVCMPKHGKHWGLIFPKSGLAGSFRGKGSEISWLGISKPQMQEGIESTCQKTSQIKSVIRVSNFAHDKLLESVGYYWMILRINLLNHAVLAISSPLFGAFRMFAYCMLGNEWKLL